MEAYLHFFFKNEKWLLAARFTFSWVMTGMIAFAFEWIITNMYHLDFPSQVSFLLYSLPPILAGFPLVMLELTYLEKHIRKLRFVYYLAAKTTLYLFGIILVYFFVWYFFLANSQENSFFNGGFFMLKYLFVWSIGTVSIFFFKNMSDHIDRKNLWRWLIGKYFKPIEEKRIFLFMDLNDSTTIAESLGHIRYFEFINDFYNISADVIERLRGEIYQYVGDEVVISWSVPNGIVNNNALNLMFAIQNRIRENRTYFFEKYGIIPEFKGSLHYGDVTRGEIGVLKKEFVFTGDVLNTASRMHNLCKTHKVSLVVSGSLLQKFDIRKGYFTHSLGKMKLKGKMNRVAIYTVEKGTGESAPSDAVCGATNSNVVKM